MSSLLCLATRKEKRIAITNNFETNGTTPQLENANEAPDEWGDTTTDWDFRGVPLYIQPKTEGQTEKPSTNEGVVEAKDPLRSTEDWDTQTAEKTVVLPSEIIEQSNNWSDWDSEPEIDIDPELSAKLDKFGEKHGAKVLQLKKFIEENPETALADKTDETLEQIVAIYGQIGMNGHSAINSLFEMPAESIAKLERSIDKVTADVLATYPEIDREKRLFIEDIFVSLARQYDPELFSEATIDEISRRVMESIKFKTIESYESRGETHYSDTYPMFQQVKYAIDTVANSKDPNCLSIYLGYWRELMDSPDDDLGSSQTKSKLLRNYFTNHGLDEKRVEGFRTNIFPLIKAHDSETAVLEQDSNSWGIGYGKYGISGYTAHCLVSEVKPQNTQELIQAYREIPTSDFKRFEQNRIDASALQGVLYGGRDFIHDEQPGVNELLSAMLDYYDSKDDVSRHAETTAKLEQIIAERLSGKKPNYYKRLHEKAMNLENYSRGVTVKSTSRFEDEEKPNFHVPAIDVLRRMVENTRAFDADNRPQTEDEGLNTILQQLDIRPNERTGEVDVNWKQVGELVRYTNDLLHSRQGQTGMRPSMVSAIAYVEKMATYSMRGISRKDWQELPYDPHFKEICRFQELTSSADNYSEKGFEQFWVRFSRVPYSEDGDFSMLQDHYRQLSSRRLKQLNALAKNYNSNEHTAYLTGSLWSGNLNHELMGLFDQG